MPVNPYLQYQKQSVMTMTHGEMLTKLYDGAIKQLNMAIISMSEKNAKSTIAANTSLRKAQKIIAYLDETLDTKYEIAGNLSSLYDFFDRQIMESLIKTDPKPIEDIIPLIQELKETFIQADKLARMEKTSNAGSGSKA